MKHLLKLVFISFYFEFIDCAPQPQSTYGTGEPHFSELPGSHQVIGAQNPIYVYGVPIFATKDQNDDVAVLIRARSGFPLDPSGAPIQLMPPNPSQIAVEGSANATTLRPLENYGNGEIAAAAAATGSAAAGDTSPPTAAADASAAPAAETPAPAAETTAAAEATTTAAA